MSFSLWTIILCCLFASSIEPILVKLGFLSGVSPFLLIVLRTVFAGGTVALLSAWQHFKVATIEEYKKIIPLALLLLSTNSLMIFALLYSSPALVITIVKLTPVGVGIGSYFFGKERVDFKFWLGVACCFIGISTTIDVQLNLDSALNAKGIILSFLAMLSSTFYRMLLGKRAQEISPKTISYSIFLSNGFIALLLLPFVYKDLNWSLIPISMWTGVAAVCANVAFIYAVKHIGAARMSVIDLLQRPLVIILSLFILNELITLKQLLVLALVVLGVYLANIGKKSRAMKEGREDNQASALRL